MNRILLAVVAAALFAGAFGLAALQPAAAQPSAPVCVTLAPGEHEFTAPARDREGEVTFTVVVGEGGQVTEFIEPGGQSIPPSAMLQLFTGENAYPLPDGVMIVECAASGDDEMMAEAAPGVCVNLDPGTHTGTVSAGGRSYEITMHVGEGGALNSVELMGQSYTAQEALGLLENFGATMPQGVNIIECAAPADAGAMEDAGDDAAGAVYPTTGTGGLADASDTGGMWAAIATVGVLLAVGAAAVARRQGVRIRIRD